LTFVTTHDARARWGTPHDTPEHVDAAFALKQSAVVCRLIEHLAQAPRLHDNIFPRFGYAAVVGRAKFLRHGELFADQPAPGTVLLSYQGPARFYVMVDHLGMFSLRGVADSKHSYHKIIFEGYKFDPKSGDVIWTIDKNKTGKAAYRLKMYRRQTDYVCEPGDDSVQPVGAADFSPLEQSQGYRRPQGIRSVALVYEQTRHLDFKLFRRFDYYDGLSGTRHTAEINPVRYGLA
jgi:hypothetical protein